MKKKILFLIHDLGQGGAEKVLINLVNNMDQTKFDITVMALFGGGINEQFLKSNIRYIKVFSKAFLGNSHIMKLFSSKILHRCFVKEKYDIEISYLEGPSARIISGCPNKDTKLISWIHCTMHNEEEFAVGFRNYDEAKHCYKVFDKCVFVSKEVKEYFLRFCDRDRENIILYNTNDSDVIVAKSKEEVKDSFFNKCDGFKLCAMGRIIPVKGFDRLALVHKYLRDKGYNIHSYILGIGPQQKEIEKKIIEMGIADSFHFMGYQTNPYKYLGKCDAFICSSLSEGFSTAVTEALILGMPIVTTNVSGMKELLGENSEFGLVVENDEESLFSGIKAILDNPDLLAYYKKQAVARGELFMKEQTVVAVENMLLNL